MVSKGRTRRAWEDLEVDGTIARQLVSQSVHEQLKREITTLVLKPGAVLSEQETAARCNASRTPVREALQRLAQEGLVERRGRHYVVRKFDWHEVRQIYEIREGLEKTAIQHAIQRATEAELDELEETVRQQSRAIIQGDIPGFIQLDSDFHIGIARFSGNTLLAQLVAQIHDKVKLFRTLDLSRNPNMAAVVNDHLRILGAIRRGDSATAEAEIRFHIADAIRRYRALTPDDGEDS